MTTPKEIADFLDEVRQTRRQLGTGELPDDSPAAHFAALAVRERGDADLSNHIVLLADLWTLIGGEQLSSLATLIRGDEYAFGLFPLARSVIEHSTATIWVIDPTVSPEQRAARAALAIYRSNQEMVTAAAHLDKTSDVYKAKKAELRAHRKRINEQFPNGTDLDARAPSVAGEHSLSPTDLVKHFANAAGTDSRQTEGIYDYLCAAANHPTLAAFEFIGSEAEGHLPTMDDDFLDRLIRTVLGPYLMALQGFAAYCSWDPTGVVAVRTKSENLFPTPSP
jgi:hypothetical protein